LQKYSPLEWSGYFDREDDIRIPDTEDVSSGQFFPLQEKFFYFLFFLIYIILLLTRFVILGVSCIFGRNRRAGCFLSAWRWLLWVCLFHYFSSTAMLFSSYLLFFIYIAIKKSALPIFFFRRSPKRNHFCDFDLNRAASLMLEY
jgi:hypothetical protein